MIKFEKHVSTLKHSIAQHLQHYKREGRQGQLSDSGADTLASDTFLHSPPTQVGEHSLGEWT